MIIDNTFFHGEIMIPNIKSSGHGSNVANIDALIESECYSFLNSLLGNKVYLDLVQYFDADLNLVDSAPQKYKDLFYGVKYEDKIWKGLIIENKLGKYSILADYVWLKWYENNVSLTAVNGEVVLESKNAININPTEKYIKVWNRLVNKVNGNVTSNKPYIGRHKCTKFVDWYGNQSVYSTLRQYLNDFKEDFENPTLCLPNGEELTIKNIFGL